MKTKKTRSLIKWIKTDFDDIKTGDLVKVTTMTHSQKYGDDYNKTRIGYLIKKKKRFV